MRKYISNDDALARFVERNQKQDIISYLGGINFINNERITP